MISPGIEFFESDKQPISEIVENTNGVATVGSCQRGPLDRVVKLTSLTQLDEIFGEPDTGHEASMVLARNVLALGVPVYFRRANAQGSSSQANFSISDQTTLGGWCPSGGVFATVSYTAKFYGEGMNGWVVTMTKDPTETPDNEKTCTIVVKHGENEIEKWTGVKSADIVTTVAKSTFVSLATTSTQGASWSIGADAAPLVFTLADGTSTAAASVENYVAALGDAGFLDTDNVAFSVVACPDVNLTSELATAMLGICTSRGDCIAVFDTGCDKAIKTASSIKTTFDGLIITKSTHACVYEGWFKVASPWDSSKELWLPASTFMAAKMIENDLSVGEGYAPAGQKYGVINVADYNFSPNQADRDTLIGGNGTINPIFFSNTYGVMAFGQKTNVTTTSPLNRINVRRLTNKIKRELRSKLQVLLFEVNNGESRGRAGRIVDDVLEPLRAKGFVESYTRKVVSGTGADRNTLNIYIDFAPIGLIEFIKVYVNISEAGVTVEEAV